MTIRAVVFDIGGVLEINPNTGWQSRWEQRLGLTLEEIDAQLIGRGMDGSLGTCTEEEWQAGLREITGVDQAQSDDFMRDFWQWYLGELNVELTDFFASLRPRYLTGILSNSFVGARRREEELYRFHEMTDDIVYSHEVGLAKPDRRIYALTCQRLGVQAAEAIFLDDAEPNVIAAGEFGMHGILFKDNAQAMADIQACILANASESAS
jgi:epoxide hydrolase-like predicted phosphatase